MKYITMIFSVILGLFLLSCDISEKGIKQIKVKRVDWGITTFFSVSCDSFDTYFRGEIDTFVINDRDKITQFLQIYGELEKKSSNYIPDVRAKVLVEYYDNHVDTLCLSHLGVLLNGSPRSKNDELIDFIDNL